MQSQTPQLSESQIASHTAALEKIGLVNADSGSTAFEYVLKKYGIDKQAYSKNPAITIVAGRNHSMVLLRDRRTILTWGADGNPALEAPKFAAGRTVRKLVAGFDFSIALLDDGKLVSWGKENTTVPAFTDFVDVYVYQWKFIALRKSGQIVLVPQETKGLSQPNFEPDSIVRVYLFGDWAAAVLKDGSLSTWSLFPWSDQAPNTPLLPPGRKITDVTQAFLLLDSGKVLTWNQLVDSDLGNDVYSAIATNSGPQYDSTTFLLLKKDGEITQWGERIPQLPVQQLLKKYSAVAVGEKHALALRNDGVFIAWGDDLYGQVSGIGRKQRFVSCVNSSGYKVSKELACGMDGCAFEACEGNNCKYVTKFDLDPKSKGSHEVDMATQAATLGLGPSIRRVFQCEQGAVAIMQKLGFTFAHYLKTMPVTETAFDAIVDLLVKATAANLWHGDAHGDNILTAKLDAKGQPLEWLFIDFNRTKFARFEKEVVQMVYEYAFQLKNNMSEQVKDEAIMSRFQRALEQYLSRTIPIKGENVVATVRKMLQK